MLKLSCVGTFICVRPVLKKKRIELAGSTIVLVRLVQTVIGAINMNLSDNNKSIISKALGDADHR